MIDDLLTVTIPRPLPTSIAPHDDPTQLSDRSVFHPPVPLLSETACKASASPSARKMKRVCPVTSAKTPPPWRCATKTARFCAAPATSPSTVRTISWRSTKGFCSVAWGCNWSLWDRVILMEKLNKRMRTKREKSRRRISSRPWNPPKHKLHKTNEARASERHRRATSTTMRWCHR